MLPKRVKKQSLEVVKPATLRVETKCQTQWGDICLCREKCKTVQGMLRSLSRNIRHRGIQTFPGFFVAGCANVQHYTMFEWTKNAVASVLHLTQCNCLSFQHKKFWKAKQYPFILLLTVKKLGGLDFFLKWNSFGAEFAVEYVWPWFSF